jgi:hypothetical protein
MPIISLAMANNCNSSHGKPLVTASVNGMEVELFHKEEFKGWWESGLLE